MSGRAGAQGPWTIYCCVEEGCDYVRDSSGFHQTEDPANPRGRMVSHPLKQVEVAPVSVLRELAEAGDWFLKAFLKALGDPAQGDLEVAIEQDFRAALAVAEPYLKEENDDG